jgi:hypothetical protein
VRAKLRKVERSELRERARRRDAAAAAMQRRSVERRPSHGDSAGSEDADGAGMTFVTGVAIERLRL